MQGGNGWPADDPTRSPASDWVLSLELATPRRLLARLGDGRWHALAAEGPWPPESGPALPAAITGAMARLGAQRLSLQLCAALDDWPWEEEVAAAGGPRPVPRYLTDLPGPDAGTSQPVPLLTVRARHGDHLEQVQAARWQQRPLVVVDAELQGARGLALERCLRGLWRDPMRLSDALALALAQLGLAQSCCRLYGDGRAQAIDLEQGWRPVTALSIDLVDSTSLLQAVGAEAYALRLRAYHELCRDVITRLQGSLDVPQGDDGLMAYFGFPLAVEDAAARALSAAWQLSRGMAELGLKVRIGVASGPVAVSAQQAFGDDIILAARLREVAQPEEILVAPSTQARVGPAFALERRSQRPAVKNFPHLEAVYRLAGLPQTPAGIVPRHGGAGRFVGRRREMERLRAAWAAARGGQLQWCVVSGEAGIGKSRLLQEFVRELRTGGGRCLELTGQAQSGQSPFAAVIDGLRQHWAFDPQADAAQMRARLLPLLPSGGSDASGDADALAQLLALPQADPTPAGAQRRGGDLLLEALLALAEPGPWCLLVDDAHWLDPSSTDLLRRLRTAGAARALLVVLAERPEGGRTAVLPDTAPLELQGLEAAEVDELVAQLGAAVPERARRHVVERAEGVPLYLEESLRMLSQRGPAAAGEMPATLEDLLMVRLDGLGPDRALAQVIAVLGRECSAAQLQALLARDDPFVERARAQGSLASLLGSGLLQALDDPQPLYRFKHALIRDAAYASLSTHDRRRLHGLCADLYASDAHDLRRSRPEHLAQHLQAAGRIAAARLVWLAAAQLAASRHAHLETIELAQRALALCDQVPDDGDRVRSAMQLHLLVASAHIALQGYGSNEVEAAYLAAEQEGSVLADSAQTLRIRLGLEACYVMRGDFTRAAELAMAAVDATRWDQDPRLALQARWALANVRFHQGGWAAALGGFDDCLEHYRPALHRRSSVQDPAIMCLGYSSWIEFELGRANLALQRIERLLTLAQALEHPFSTGVALGFAASIKRLCGDVDGAWPHALEAVRVCERGGFQAWLAHAWMVRGQLRADRGDAAGGDEDMGRGYALWTAGGARISCATYMATRGEILLRQGRTGEAAAELDAGWRASEQIGEHYYQAELLRLQGLCAWQGGDADRAGAVLQQALALARGQQKPGLQLRCALALGALDVQQGRCDVAAARLRPLLAALPDHGRSRDARWAQAALPLWERGAGWLSLGHTPWEPR